MRLHNKPCPKAKIFFSVLFNLAFLHTLLAQKEEIIYLDADGKVTTSLLARFAQVIKNTDSGQERKDYYLSNEKLRQYGHYTGPDFKLRHGTFQSFYPNGNPEHAGTYIQDLPDGLHLRYHYNGMMRDSTFYTMGRQVGIAKRWYPNGFVRDSIIQRNDSLAVMVSWFDDGTPMAAGLLLYGKKTGTWQYFRSNGKLARKVRYLMGDEVMSWYFDENGVETTGHLPDQPATFKGGPGAWNTYLNKNLYWPGNMTFKDGNQATVSVKFTVDHNGKVKDAFVDVPFHPEFDKIALKVIMLSNKWEPAVLHNRQVDYTMRQRVTFSQPD